MSSGHRTTHGSPATPEDAALVKRIPARQARAIATILAPDLKREAEQIRRAFSAAKVAGQGRRLSAALRIALATHLDRA